MEINIINLNKMENINIIIDFNNPIKILVPISIEHKLIDYIIEWKDKSIPGLIEFILQDKLFGYNIRNAIIKLNNLENSDNNRILYLEYDKNNKLDITFEIYAYNGKNMSLILSNGDRNKIITDTRDLTALNEAIEWIHGQTKRFDEFLNDIIPTK